VSAQTHRVCQASESTSYIDPAFSSHYTGASNAGLIRGGYHFAVPADSTGAAQADYFVANGGGWSGDGRTLPGMLDLETNPYGADQCYGLSPGAMVSWIRDFADAYKAQAGRYPMIYTTASWWEACTGDSSSFSQQCPLVLARWGSEPGRVPGGWPTYSFWQNNNNYAFGGDSEIWNGSMDSLNKFANGG
jgi:GH25 family lysozyme M1 (1,4-beta-N-acetylmuramidase)